MILSKLWKNKHNAFEFLLVLFWIFLHTVIFRRKKFISKIEKVYI